jgi:hypothetical protein
MSKRGGGNIKAYENGLQKYVNSIRRPNEEVFVENSDYARHHIKRRVIEQSLIPYKCFGCDNKGEWMGNPLPLILDHINGVNNDNRIENLRFACSNCDSQLDTYKNRRGNKK